MNCTDSSSHRFGGVDRVFAGAAIILVSAAIFVVGCNLFLAPVAKPFRTPTPQGDPITPSPLLWGMVMPPALPRIRTSQYATNLLDGFISLYNTATGRPLAESILKSDVEIAWVMGPTSSAAPGPNRINIGTDVFASWLPSQGAGHIAGILAHEAYHLFGPYAADAGSLCEEYMAYWTGDLVMNELEEKGFASELYRLNFANVDPRVQSSLEKFFEQDATRPYLEDFRAGAITAYPAHPCPP